MKRITEAIRRLAAPCAKTLALLATLGLFATANATTYTWTGNAKKDVDGETVADTSWDTLENWSIPAPTETDANATATPSEAPNAESADVVIAKEATVTLSSDRVVGTITISQPVTLEGACVRATSLTGGGTVTLNPGAGFKTYQTAKGKGTKTLTISNNLVFKGTEASPNILAGNGADDKTALNDSDSSTVTISSGVTFTGDTTAFLETHGDRATIVLSAADLSNYKGTIKVCASYNNRNYTILNAPSDSYANIRWIVSTGKSNLARTDAEYALGRLSGSIEQNDKTVDGSKATYTIGSLATADDVDELGGVYSRNSGIRPNEGSTIKKVGAGTLKFSGKGAMQLQAAGGILRLEKDQTVTGGGSGYRTSALPAGGTIQLGTEFTEDLSAYLASTTDAALIFDTDGTDRTFASKINAAGLTKKGAGTLTLSAANTYTETTTISGGTLRLLNGSVAGDISVEAAGTLQIPVATLAAFTKTITVADGGKVIVDMSGYTKEEDAESLTLATTTVLDVKGTLADTISFANTQYTMGTPTLSEDSITVSLTGDVGNTASTWTGAANDGLWATPGNWSTYLVPDSSTAVTFNDDATVAATGHDSGSSNPVGSIAIAEGKTLTLYTVGDPNGTGSGYAALNVYGDITGTGATLKLIRFGLIRQNTASTDLNIEPDVVFQNNGTRDSFVSSGTSGSFAFKGSVSGTGKFNAYASPKFYGAVTLDSGAELYIDQYAGSFEDGSTLTGSGTLTYARCFPPDSAKSLLQNEESWTGVLELYNKTHTSVWWIGDYGNANSTVRFNNFITYLMNTAYDTGDHSVGTVEIASGGWQVNGTYNASQTWNFPFKLTGTGKFIVGTASNTAGTYQKPFVFSGDCSEFAGSVEFKSDSNDSRVVFGTTDRDFAQNTVVIGDGATVGAGNAWSAEKIYVDGTLAITAAGATFSPALVGAGVIDGKVYPTTAPALDATDWTGEFVIDWTVNSGALNFDRYGTANSTVVLGTAMTAGYIGTGTKEAVTFSTKVRLDADMTIADGWADTTDWTYTVTFTELSGKANANFTRVNTTPDATLAYDIKTLKDYTGTITLGNKNILKIEKVALESFPTDGSAVVALTINAVSGSNAIGKLYNADATETTATTGLIATTVGEDAEAGPGLYLGDGGLYAAIASVTGDDDATAYYSTLEAAAAAARQNTTAAKAYTLLYADAGTLPGWYAGEGDSANVYTLTENKVEVDGTSYATIAAASEARTENATIILLADNDEDVTLASGETLDTNGYVYTGTVGGAGSIIVTVAPTDTAQPTLAEGWTGTYAIAWNTSAKAGWQFQSYGNENSTVCLMNDANGYFTNGSAHPEVKPALWLKGGVTLAINDGYSSETDNEWSNVAALSELGGGAGSAFNIVWTTTPTTSLAPKFPYYSIGKIDNFSGSITLGNNIRLMIEKVNLTDAPTIGETAIPVTINEATSFHTIGKVFNADKKDATGAGIAVTVAGEASDYILVLGDEGLYLPELVVTVPGEGTTFPTDSLSAVLYAHMSGIAGTTIKSYGTVDSRLIASMTSSGYDYDADSQTFTLLATVASIEYNDKVWEYTSIQRAIEGAIAVNVSTVNVVAGTEYTEDLKITGDVTLNLAGNVTVNSVTIENATLTLAASSTAEFRTKESLGNVAGGLAVGRTANTTAGLVIGANVTVNAALVPVGYAEGATGTIEVKEGGKLVAAYLKIGSESSCAAGTLKVTGGTVTASAEFVVGAKGTVDIESGTVAANVNAPDIRAGAAFVIAPVAEDATPLLTFANSVTINGSASVPETTTLATGTTYKLATVTGDGATLKNSATFTPDTWELKVSEDGKSLLLAEKPPVATIDDTPYYTLQAAVNAALESETEVVITLNASGETATITGTVKIKKGDNTCTINPASGYEVTEGEADEDGITTYTVEVVRLDLYWFGNAEDGLWATAANWSTVWNIYTASGRAPGENTADTVEVMSVAAIKLPAGKTEVAKIEVSRECTELTLGAADEAGDTAELTTPSLAGLGDSRKIVVGKNVKFTRNADYLETAASFAVEAGGEFVNAKGDVVFTGGTQTIDGTLTATDGKFILRTGASTVTVGATGKIDAKGIEVQSVEGIALTINGTADITGDISVAANTTITLPATSGTPLVSATGNVTLNGTINVLATSETLAAGTYRLLSTTGTLAYSGATVTGGTLGEESVENDGVTTRYLTFTVAGEEADVTIGASTVVYEAADKATITVVVSGDDAATAEYSIGTAKGVYDAESDTVTFTGVDVPKKPGDTFEYTVTAGDKTSTVSTYVGDKSNWFSTKAGSDPEGGNWSEGVDTTGESIAVSDSAFTLDKQVGEGIAEITMVGSFADVNAGDVEDSNAKAAVKIASVDGKNTFQVWTIVDDEKGWVSVTAGDIVPSTEAVYTVVVTVNYNPETYAVTIEGKTCKDAEGNAAFDLADSSAAIGKIAFQGSGSVTSLAGEYYDTSAVKDEAGNKYATVEAAVEAYYAGKATTKLTVYHSGTTDGEFPEGWVMDSETGVLSLKSVVARRYTAENEYVEYPSIQTAIEAAVAADETATDIFGVKVVAESEEELDIPSDKTVYLTDAVIPEKATDTATPVQFKGTVSESGGMLRYNYVTTRNAILATEASIADSRDYYVCKKLGTDTDLWFEIADGGKLTLSNGTKLESPSSTRIGSVNGATVEFTLTGEGTAFKSAEAINIAHNQESVATLTISEGASIETPKSVVVGNGVSSKATLNANSDLDLTGGVVQIGHGTSATGIVNVAVGTLTVGGNNDNPYIDVGTGANSYGEVNVSGTGKIQIKQMPLGCKTGAEAYLNISDSGVVEITNTVQIARDESTKSTVTVSGGSLWTNGDLTLGVGASSTAALRITGGTVEVAYNKALLIGGGGDAVASVEIGGGDETATLKPGKGVRFGHSNANASEIVTVKQNGVLAINASSADWGYHIHCNNEGTTSKLVFDGGTLSVIGANMTNGFIDSGKGLKTVIAAGGMIYDSAYAATLNVSVLSADEDVTAPRLMKKGTGTLTLTGDTVPNGFTVTVADADSSSVVFPATLESSVTLGDHTVITARDTEAGTVTATYASEVELTIEVADNATVEKVEQTVDGVTTTVAKEGDVYKVAYGADVTITYAGATGYYISSETKTKILTGVKTYQTVAAPEEVTVARCPWKIVNSGETYYETLAKAYEYSKDNGNVLIRQNVDATSEDFTVGSDETLYLLVSNTQSFNGKITLSGGALKLDNNTAGNALKGGIVATAETTSYIECVGTPRLDGCAISGSGTLVSKTGLKAGARFATANPDFYGTLVFQAGAARGESEELTATGLFSKDAVNQNVAVEVTPAESFAAKGIALDCEFSGTATMKSLNVANQNAGIYVKNGDTTFAIAGGEGVTSTLNGSIALEASNKYLKVSQIGAGKLSLGSGFAMGGGDDLGLKHKSAAVTVSGQSFLLNVDVGTLDVAEGATLTNVDVTLADGVKVTAGFTAKSIAADAEKLVAVDEDGEELSGKTVKIETIEESGLVQLSIVDAEAEDDVEVKFEGSNFKLTKDAAETIKTMFDIADTESDDFKSAAVSYVLGLYTESEGVATVTEVPTPFIDIDTDGKVTVSYGEDAWTVQSGYTVTSYLVADTDLTKVGADFKAGDSTTYVAKATLGTALVDANDGKAEKKFYKVIVVITNGDTNITNVGGDSGVTIGEGEPPPDAD